MLIIKLHSVVDLITNSSTVIFTYQDSVTETKALVSEILKLSGDAESSPDDVFWYGVFCESDEYLERLREIEDVPERGNNPHEYGTPSYKLFEKEEEDWLNDLQLSIMKGEIEQPEWMTEIEGGYDDMPLPTYLHLVAKEQKYEVLSDKIRELLGSVYSEEGPQ